MDDAGGVLDAEYREFVRSQHDTTIAIYVAVQSWWHENPCRRILASQLAERTPLAEDVQGAVSSVSQWNGDVRPRLAILIAGHPDPDVRDAAALLAWRVYALRFLVAPVLSGRDPSPHLELIRRVVDPDRTSESLRRLGHAVRDAPLRIHRPRAVPDRFPSDDSENWPSSFSLWLDRLEQRERDFRPAGGDEEDADIR